MHSKELIHRDISPKNALIWVNPNNTDQVLMKWTVFGFGKVNERGNYIGSREIGPESWLAPEILTLVNNTSSSNNDIKSARLQGSAKSDVYAEGLVFGRFLLKGRHIFGKRTEIPSNILDDEKVNITSIYDLKL
jgi:serine/threonine protein kinase